MENGDNNQRPDLFIVRNENGKPVGRPNKTPRTAKHLLRMALERIRDRKKTGLPEKTVESLENVADRMEQRIEVKQALDS